MKLLILHKHETLQMLRFKYRIIQKQAHSSWFPFSIPFSYFVRKISTALLLTPNLEERCFLTASKGKMCAKLSQKGLVSWE